MTIAKRINTIQQHIQQYEAASHRKPGAVHLLAVTKGQSSQMIKTAIAAGLYDFGESYLQEALPKIHDLATHPLCWHFIGPIQSNKTKGIALKFSWAHSVCRRKIAQQLNDARPTFMRPLNVCIQVNLDDEETKSGISPHLVAELAAYIIQLPHLQLRGLMCIPEQHVDEQQQSLTYLRLADLLHGLNMQFNLAMDTLSMGMSNDLHAAIRAGSTMVRVGRGIFEER